MTPILMLLLAGAQTDVDGAGMALSLVQTVLVPVIGGLVLRYLLDRRICYNELDLTWIYFVCIGGVVFTSVAHYVVQLDTVGGIIIDDEFLLYNVYLCL